MAKLSTIIVAVATLLAGVQAQCPQKTRNHLLCGSELINVFGCASQGQLEVLAGGQGVVNSNLYHVNDIGTPDQYIRDCQSRGCSNLDSHQDGSDAFCF